MVIKDVEREDIDFICKVSVLMGAFIKWLIVPSQHYTSPSVTRFCVCDTEQNHCGVRIMGRRVIEMISSQFQNTMLWVRYANNVPDMGFTMLYGWLNDVVSKGLFQFDIVCCKMYFTNHYVSDPGLPSRCFPGSLQCRKPRICRLGGRGAGWRQQDCEGKVHYITYCS